MPTSNYIHPCICFQHPSRCQNMVGGLNIIHYFSNQGEEDNTSGILNMYRIYVLAALNLGMKRDEINLIRLKISYLLLLIWFVHEMPWRPLSKIYVHFVSMQAFLNFFHPTILYDIIVSLAVCGFKRNHVSLLTTSSSFLEIRELFLLPLLHQLFSYIMDSFF